jgi:hypothetical protein
MQALIIDREAARLDHSLITLMEAGIQVTGTGNVQVAETCINRMGVDLLVIEKDTIGDALGDTLGMAEERNPYLVSILRTSNVGEDHEELSPYFPSLHCVVGLDVPNDVAVKLGVASLRSQVAFGASRPRALTQTRSRLTGLTQPLMKPTPQPVHVLTNAV